VIPRAGIGRQQRRCQSLAPGCGSRKSEIRRQNRRARAVNHAQRRSHGAFEIRRKCRSGRSTESCGRQQQGEAHLYAAGSGDLPPASMGAAHSRLCGFYRSPLPWQKWMQRCVFSKVCNARDAQALSPSGERPRQFMEVWLISKCLVQPAKLER